MLKEMLGRVQSELRDAIVIIIFTTSRHLSLIAPSNVSFLVKGGGTIGGPQFFSF